MIQAPGSLADRATVIIKRKLSRGFESCMGISPSMIHFRSKSQLHAWLRFHFSFSVLIHDMKFILSSCALIKFHIMILWLFRAKDELQKADVAPSAEENAPPAPEVADDAVDFGYSIEVKEVIFYLGLEFCVSFLTASLIANTGFGKSSGRILYLTKTCGNTRSFTRILSL